MCDLLLPRGIKGLSACSVFFSINNFNQKSFLKTTFERRIKAVVSIKYICKCIRFVYLILPCINFGKFDFAFFSWHITILFPVLHINIWIYVQIVSSAIEANLCRTFNGSDTLLHNYKLPSLESIVG